MNPAIPIAGAIALAVTVRLLIQKQVNARLKQTGIIEPKKSNVTKIRAKSRKKAKA